MTRKPVDADRQGRHQGGARAAAANFAGGSTVWDSLAQCESGGNWAINTGNGYYGGLQFNLGTWQAYGGTGLPSEHSRETQIAIATKAPRRQRWLRRLAALLGAAGPAPVAITRSTRDGRRPVATTSATRLTPMPEPADTTSAGPRLLGPADVRSLAAALDLRPTKQRGQNFVIDANTVRRIVRESGVSADDVVLEVGPGLGSLTLALLAVARRVVAVEVDPVLAEALPATIATYAPAEAAQFEVVLADALRVTEIPGPPPTALVANLPYNVSVPVLLHLLALLPSLEHGLVMVQAEVADRLAAPPGSKVYGVPSVKAAWYADVRRAGSIGRNVFWPAPNVDSGPGRLDPPRAAGHHRHPRAGLRGRRRGVRAPAQDAALDAQGDGRLRRPRPRPRWRTPASTRWPAARCSASQEFARVAEGLHLDD